jgi:peptidoglycan hydrolase CwlO-like protein
VEELDLKKKLVAIALAGTILATSIVTPFTAQADEILTKIQQQETKISELDSKQSTVEETLSVITAEVDAAEKRAETLLANRVKTQDEIAALQEDIAELQVVIAQREEQLDEQARSVQVNGSNENYLNFIVASESFTDLVSRIDVVSKMVSANKELVEQQIADQKAVEDKKSKTEENLSKINAMAMELEQLKGDLQVKKIEQESAIAALAAEKATAESDRQMFLAQKEEADQRAAAEAAAIAAAEAAAATVAATVAQASSEESSTAASSVDIASSTVASSESAAPAQTVAAAPVVESAPVVSAPAAAAPVVSAPVVSAPVVTAPTLSAPTGDVVSIAAKYIGVPYVWGGKTPSGFDCSGFTSYVFREAYGIEIGGYTVPQENSGTQIAVSSAQAGDLIFWGSRGATYHVAIYVGGGQYIHAPAPGQTVTYSSYNLSGASFAVRVAR